MDKTHVNNNQEGVVRAEMREIGNKTISVHETARQFKMSCMTESFHQDS